MDARINWESRLGVKSGPGKTERAALESELFKVRQQHGASLAKALSGGFSPEEEAAHEERVNVLAYGEGCNSSSNLKMGFSPHAARVIAHPRREGHFTAYVPSIFRMIFSAH